MISKVIHYCWLSNDPYPDKIQKCMDTWKKVLPDYEIKLWNTENFDMSKAPVYVREAFEQRKWALLQIISVCMRYIPKVVFILTLM